MLFNINNSIVAIDPTPFLLVALPINRLCTGTYTSHMISKQTIYNQVYGYQTLNNYPTAKRACLGRSSVGQQ